jgi:hypothetical protein
MTSIPPPPNQDSSEIPAASTPPKEPNHKALEVMKAIEAIHATMNPKPGRSCVEIIREGREGAMYG